MRIAPFYFFSAVILTQHLAAQESANFPTIGEIVRVDPLLDELIASDSRIEVLASGFDWSEGPVWIPRDGGFLLFSDVPQNTIFKWQPGKGISTYMKPSGYTGWAVTAVSPAVMGSPSTPMVS